MLISSFLNLPDSIVCHVLTSWLKLQDIGYLDVAVCARKYRQAFLHAAFTPVCVYVYPSDHLLSRDEEKDTEKYSDEPTTCDCFTGWCLSRGAQMDGLHITGLLSQRKVSQIITQTGRNMNWISWHVFPGYSDVEVERLVSDMVLHCSRMTHASFEVTSGGHYDDVHQHNASATLNAHNLVRLTRAWSALQHLRLEKLNLTSAGLATILDSLPNSLVALEVLRCKGINSLPVEVALPTLQLLHLDLPKAVVNDAAVCTIATGCPHLRVLLTNNSHKVTPRALLALAAHCLRLESTDLVCHSEAGLAASLELYRSCSIADLNLKWQRGLTEERLSAMLPLCPALTNLDLFYRDRCVTDDTMGLLAQYCRSLTALDITGCTLVTAEGLRAVCHPDNQLRELHISRLPCVHDISLAHIAHSCPRLSKLSLSACVKLTDAGIIMLVSHCSLLTHLDIEGCTKLTDKALRVIDTHCPLLRCVCVNGLKMTSKSVTTLIAQKGRSKRRLLCKDTD